MKNAINTVLQNVKEINAAKKSKTKVPALIYDGDSAVINILIRLLEPLAIFTDQLQADCVTISIVQLGFVNALKSNFEGFHCIHSLLNVLVIYIKF